MGSFMFLVLILTSATVYSINRPVYKVSLTQRGFTQFLQYDVETPPIREFTFCIWLRFFDLSYEQSIFSYIANSNHRVIRLWLDSGGHFLKISLNGGPATSAPVDITENTWRHICLSYQSDFGTWALYLDGALISCEATQSLFGNILPAGGSVIIGYGTTESGIRSGFEGEAFGVNMILISTIERNYTMGKDPQYQQKQFNKNKISGGNNLKYMVLENLSDDVLRESIVYSTTRLPFYNSTRSIIKIKTPQREIEHDLGLDDIHRKRTRMIDTSNKQEIIDLSIANKEKFRSSEEIINFSDIESNKATVHSRAKIKNKGILFNIDNEDFSTPSEFEIPPPVISFEDYIRGNMKFTNPINRSLKDTIENRKINPYLAESMLQLYKHKLQDVKIPPLPKNNVKVYGQWTSSQFANSVLNYLKRFNNEYKEQIKVPPTIPLTRALDNFPYASEFKVTKVHPPLEFQSKKNTNTDIIKRVGKYPQINIEILKDDLRSQIMKSHANTRPINIEISNRGLVKSIKEHRNYRHADNQLSAKEEHSSDILDFSSSLSSIKRNLKNYPPHFNFYKTDSLTTMLPFIKSSEYSTGGEDSKNDMYTKSLSNDNEWHNLNLYSNVNTPRPFIVELQKVDGGINKKLSEVNKKKTSINLKYIPENHKVVKTLDDSAMLDARTLALEISNLSNLNTFSNFSILKYNQGFLPIKNKYKKMDNKSYFIKMKNGYDKRDLNKDSFNRNVKIGNALSERLIIGVNEEQNKQSFIGGNEKIPDVGRYRSDIDRDSAKVPPSLGPRICKNVELNSHQFYVQPDGSVDVTNIWSPIKEKNVGVYFVLQNYKKCSLEESSFQRSPLLLIDWNKTPVRLFGGANPKKTTDLCGFF